MWAFLVLTRAEVSDVTETILFPCLGYPCSSYKDMLGTERPEYGLEEIEVECWEFGV